MNTKISNLIKSHVSLYNKAERILKQTQHVTDEIDVTVLNEFRYAHRALISCLEILAVDPNITGDEEDFAGYWRDAQKGICIAINDAVDTVLIQTKFVIQEFNTEYPDVDIRECIGIEQFQSLVSAIGSLEAKQTETREFRKDRVMEYEKMADSDQLSLLVNFMRGKEGVATELAKRQATMRRQLDEAKEALEIARQQLALSVANASIARKTYILTIAGIAITCLLTYFAQK